MTFPLLSLYQSDTLGMYFLPHYSMTIVDDIIAYESGELNEEQVIELFQKLIDSGQAWQLQGSYGRMAQSLIDNGLCTLGEKGHKDYYGNYVPSKNEVKKGTIGSQEYVDSNS